MVWWLTMVDELPEAWITVQEYMEKNPLMRPKGALGQWAKGWSSKGAPIKGLGCPRPGVARVWMVDEANIDAFWATRGNNLFKPGDKRLTKFSYLPAELKVFELRKGKCSFCGERQEVDEDGMGSWVPRLMVSRGRWLSSGRDVSGVAVVCPVCRKITDEWLSKAVNKNPAPGDVPTYDRQRDGAWEDVEPSLLRWSFHLEKVGLELSKINGAGYRCSLMRGWQEDLAGLNSLPFDQYDERIAEWSAVSKIEGPIRPYLRHGRGFVFNGISIPAKTTI